MLLHMSCANCVLGSGDPNQLTVLVWSPSGPNSKLCLSLRSQLILFTSKLEIRTSQLVSHCVKDKQQLKPSLIQVIQLLTYP